LATYALPTAGEEALEEDNSRKSKDWISRDGRHERSFSSGARERTSDRLVSTTDPDATPMRISGSESEAKLGYQAHYVVDGGKARVILNVLVTPSEVTENRPMLDLLWSSVFRWRIRPRQVSGDAKYGTRQNVAALEKAGIRAYVAIPTFDFRKTGLFGPGHFRYDPENDHYLCPAGRTLRFQSEDHHNRRKRYRAKSSICDACELKAKCTTSKRGRVLYRVFEEDFYDRVRRYRGTFAYEKALRKRRVWVEPLFAEAKDWHGMRRFRLRRLKKVNMEALLIASGQNVKRLLAFGGLRPKKLAQAAALRPPTAATGHEIGSVREHRSNRSWRPTKAFFNTLVRFWYKGKGGCPESVVYFSGRLAIITFLRRYIIRYEPTPTKSNNRSKKVLYFVIV
jgi:Transposase DDE domain